MRLRCFAYLVISILTYSSVHAQNDDALKKEIAEIHFERHQQKDSLLLLMKECNAQIKSAVDPEKIELWKLRLDTLYNILDAHSIAELKINLQFAKQHPYSMYCLELVKSRLTTFEAMELYEEFESTFENFSPEIKSSEQGQIMRSRLASFKKSKVGSVAPDFKVLDLNNDSLSLNEFHGKKYILIDFWAGWCAPCLEEIPYLKEIHKKYGDSLEIISISKDDKLENWKKTVAKLQIDHWRHFAVEANDPTLLTDYFVFGIPHKLLIDKNGVIIGKWKGGGLNNKHSLQQLLSTILDSVHH